MTFVSNSKCTLSLNLKMYLVKHCVVNNTLVNGGEVKGHPQVCPESLHKDEVGLNLERKKINLSQLENKHGI